MLKVIGALIPSAGLLLLFWMALRAIVQADRRERVAEAKWHREHGTSGPVGADEGPAGSADVGAAADTDGSTTVSTADPADGGSTSGPA